ncbi:MAG: hypothetical protein R3B91_13930 [Planctomycetaceae bacterium]
MDKGYRGYNDEGEAAVYIASSYTHPEKTKAASQCGGTEDPATSNAKAVSVAAS